MTQTLAEIRTKIGLMPNYAKIGILSILGIIILVWIISSLRAPTTIEAVEDTAFKLTSEDCGYDKQCFIEQANNCAKTSVKEDIAGSTILYYARECKLKKKIDEFAEDEAEEVEAFLRGRTMECMYEQGNFDEELINGLLGGIEQCDGELKEAIYELRIAQFTY